VAVDVLARRADAVRALPCPPRPARAGRQRAVDRLQQRDEIAPDVDRPEHVGVAEVQLRVGQPCEQGAPVLENDGRDRGSAIGQQFEAVPQHEPDRRGCHTSSDAAERPSIECGRRERSEVARKCADRKCPKSFAAIDRFHGVQSSPAGTIVKGGRRQCSTAGHRSQTMHTRISAQTKGQTP
jgi:hypothetical protein